MHDSGSEITLTYTSTRGEISQWYWRKWKRGYWIVHLILFLIVSSFATGLFTPFVPVDFIYSALVGLAAVLVLVAFPQLSFKSQARTLTINGEGIKTTIGGRSGAVPWVDIKSIEYTRDEAYLIKRSGNAFIVPRRAFSSSDEQNNFIQTAIKWWQAKMLNPELKKRRKREYVWYAVATAIGYAAASIAVQSFLNRSNTQQEAQNAANNVAGYYANTSTWKQYDSAINGFQVMFPTYPQHQTETAAIPNSNLNVTVDFYQSAEPNGTTYYIGVSSYPTSSNVSNPENNLEGSLNGMIQSVPGNQVVSSSIGTFGQYMALKYTIVNNQASGGPVYLQGRAFLKGYGLYNQFVEYGKQDYNSTTYNEFMNSFTLIGGN